ANGSTSAAGSATWPRAAAPRSSHDRISACDSALLVGDQFEDLVLVEPFELGRIGRHLLVMRWVDVAPIGLAAGTVGAVENDLLAGHPDGPIIFEAVGTQVSIVQPGFHDRDDGLAGIDDLAVLAHRMTVADLLAVGDRGKAVRVRWAFFQRRAPAMTDQKLKRLKRGWDSGGEGKSDSDSDHR